MSTAEPGQIRGASALIATSSAFALSSEELAEIHHEMSHYEDARAASIEALKIVQQHRGWVPDGAIYAIGDLLGIPASDVEGVATFYSQIFRQPVGRHIIRVCNSMVCFIAGHESVVEEIQNSLGIAPGQTTADGRFTLLPVCCLGNCDKAPAVMVDDDTFGDVQPSGVAKMLEGYP